MKKIFGLLVMISVLVSCKDAQKENTEQTTENTEEIAEATYVPFGAKVEADNAIDAAKMKETFEALPVGDSLDTKLTATVNSVCQTKGCWMKLDLGNGEEVMVRFKDYGFFMPKNIAGKEVIVDGLAFVDEMSVQDLKHYAEDAGKSEEEIAAITEPKKTYSFVADGVLLVEK
ncbi:DUF4920 domain-containing protein [Mangrovimonas cancribranchiae]|uniref:DUF4920 domain-containing protein n=1 Tax=Mangrovimonas cancribranchiae TaxID=3080055 RepID=A0AAU6P9Y0_9FLAO